MRLIFNTKNDFIEKKKRLIEVFIRSKKSPAGFKFESGNMPNMFKFKASRGCNYFSALRISNKLGPSLFNIKQNNSAVFCVSYNAECASLPSNSMPA